MPYLPLYIDQNSRSNIEIHYLGYYLKWTPQEAYYYAVENSNFRARPFRTQGTYSKYNSIDDKIDDLHYFTTFVKFGLGRASYDASQEIRNKHISREEGKILVKKYEVTKSGSNLQIAERLAKVKGHIIKKKADIKIIEHFLKTPIKSKHFKFIPLKM